MTDEHPTPATPDHLAQALAQARQFDGRKQFKASGEMMARITAAHLLECLERAGFVIMKRPGSQGYRAPT